MGLWYNIYTTDIYTVNNFSSHAFSWPLGRLAGPGKTTERTKDLLTYFNAGGLFSYMNASESKTFLPRDRKKHRRALLDERRTINMTIRALA
jgi:predicted enzyme related to lactoylglutathione lyase